MQLRKRYQSPAGLRNRQHVSVFLEDRCLSKPSFQSIPIFLIFFLRVGALFPINLRSIFFSNVFSSVAPWYESTLQNASYSPPPFVVGRSSTTTSTTVSRRCEQNDDTMRHETTSSIDTQKVTMLERRKHQYLRSCKHKRSSSLSTMSGLQKRHVENNEIISIP